MGNDHYQRLITEWCAATGMPVWPPNEDKHVEIDETLVGLIPGGADEPDALHIYIDLGRYEAPDMYPSLLEANLSPAPGEPGCFCLHPLTGSVVYRTSRKLDHSTDGALLPQQLQALIAGARHRLDAAFAH